MANPWHHADSSSRKWGGVPGDYLEIHQWFDATKAFLPDFRHRALRHHAEGIFLMESIFGVTITLSTCVACGERENRHGPGLREEAGLRPCDFKAKLIPTRWVGEQHVQEDLGHIPTAADWLECITPAPWMNRSRKLSKELEQEGVSA